MRNCIIKDKSIIVSIAIIISTLALTAFSQGIENETRYIRIGELQSHFSAYGSERAYNNSYYEGMRWPADYSLTDNSVIRRAWIATEDYTDENSVHWDYWATYISLGYVELSLFPVELKQTSKFNLPNVYVDGDNVTATYATDIDEIDENQIPDRIVKNVVNTSCGLTMTRTIYAFSQQYHDNYFIKIFTFKNTGNTDYDDDIELTAPLKGVRFGWSTRYSVCREGASVSDNQQSWGKHTWVSKRGEDYNNHAADVAAFTEATPLEQLEYIRCGFAWLGQSELVAYNMTGAPALKKKGRLASPQFVGSGVIHVDKSTSDKTDDASQPAVLGWHAGDTYPSVGELTDDYRLAMGQVWNFLDGEPYPTDSKGGNGRFFEEQTGDGVTGNILSMKDPYTVHGDGGGTNIWIGYGPFDIDHGDSIVVVEVEGINGLSRTQCFEIGGKWLDAYTSGVSENYELPDGTTTTDKDLYKNSWVFTGVDSILLTMSRAIRNYNSGYQIPQPPLPPASFSVESGGDKISLSWLPSESEADGDFAGYRLYRAISKPDTVFDLIAELPPGVTSYEDVSPVRGFNYYYYLAAYNDGSNNTEGITNPKGSLESGRFYTRTTKGATLQRMPGNSFNDIRVVPNPFNVKSEAFQFTGDQQDQIAFYNIPAYCKIKIFTERGDLVQVMDHTDGSGDERWNSVTSSRQVVVSGVYIAHFEVTEDCTDAEGNITFRKGDTSIKKFIVIR